MDKSKVARFLWLMMYLHCLYKALYREHQASLVRLLISSLFATTKKIQTTLTKCNNYHP